MLGFPVVYSDEYELKLGPHVFPAEKYRMIRDRLVAEGYARPAEFLEPPIAADEDVLLVHTREWVTKLLEGTITPEEIVQMEVPYSRGLVRAFWFSAGGSILACRLALEAGGAANLCGGFHHAFPDHGEGFCVIHDVAIAIRRLQKDRRIRRAMVIDTDVHQGNGTAAIFRGDPDVFTFSIHQEHNYPVWKPPSTLDINLPDRTGDEEYLAQLKGGIEKALEAFEPELICYIAGADPYREDQLGGLALTMEGLRQRDDLVCRTARRRNVPVFVTLAGGYARRVDDTVIIHTNTLLALRDSLKAAHNG